MSKGKDAMTKERWKHIKSLKAGKRQFHVSCEAKMIVTPKGKLKPWVGPGTTLVVHRAARRSHNETNTPCAA